MAFYEKYVNSKFYHFTDFLFKFIMLNILMIITSILGLIIIGLPISILTGVLTLRMIYKKGASGVFKIYFKTLKYVLKRSIRAIIVFVILLAILAFNITFFYTGLEPFNWYYFFSFMVMLLMFIITIVSFIHGLMLSSIYDLSLKSLFKHSYLLSFGLSVRGLIFLVGSIIIVYTLILIPILVIFVGLSSFSLLIYTTLTLGYSKIDSLESSLNEIIEKLYD